VLPLTQQLSLLWSNLNYSLLEAVRLDRNMMLTVDEYMALRRLIGSERESEGATLASEEPKPARKRSASAKKSDKKMSMALEQANSELRKSNGDLRKGVTQADVMTRAHKIRRSM
jgi:hypothetical protein